MPRVCELINISVWKTIKGMCGTSVKPFIACDVIYISSSWWCCRGTWQSGDVNGIRECNLWYVDTHSHRLRHTRPNVITHRSPLANYHHRPTYIMMWINVQADTETLHTCFFHLMIYLLKHPVNAIFACSRRHAVMAQHDTSFPTLLLLAMLIQTIFIIHLLNINLLKLYGMFWSSQNDMFHIPQLYVRIDK